MKTYRGSRGLAPHILNLGDKWRWVVGFIPRERTAVCTEKGAGWAPETVWTFWLREIYVAFTGIRTPVRPARSVAAYRISYPGSFSVMIQIKSCVLIWFKFVWSYVLSTWLCDQFSSKKWRIIQLNLCVCLRQKHSNLNVGACNNLFEIGYVQVYCGGTRWRSWLRHCATSRKVAVSIPDGVIGIFHWHNPSGRTMALGSTQPLTEMITVNISLG